MAVKIKVKSSGPTKQVGDNGKREAEKKIKIKAKTSEKSESSTLPDIDKDPTIKGPITFLNSYYNSPEFNERYKNKNFTPFDNSNVRLAQQYGKIEKGAYDAGSNAVNPVHLRAWKSAGIKPGTYPTVMVDTAEAKAIKSDVESDTVPHEYSHTSRGLTLGEEKDIISKNRNKKIAVKYPFERYEKSGEIGNSIASGLYENLYSNYLASKSPSSHDEQPQENYADLNALRYMLYKQGIYDTRKGPMTIEHLQKAMNDPWLKKQFSFQRMLKNFKLEDIVNLNNTIAYNQKDENQNTA